MSQSNKDSRYLILQTPSKEEYKITVHEGDVAILAKDLAQIKLKTSTNQEEKQITSFDPGFMNTACCESTITYIDGDKGILRYRGYPIEQLAEKSNFLEVAYLLIYGELPTATQLETWQERIMSHTYIHVTLMDYMKSFRYDAHPMSMFIATMAAMSTEYPESNPTLTRRDLFEFDHRARNQQIFRILGKAPTIAACAYRHRIGRPYNYPTESFRGYSYTENFLYMLDRLSEPDYRPSPAIAKALDVLFIVHADHELNCSTAAMRHLTSTRVDPYTAVAGAAGALYGPLHGGASEAVVRMLEEIGSVDKIDEFLSGVKSKSRRLMGFGHRIYKNYDPRAKILKEYAEKVFAEVGRDPLIDIAVELERRATQDDYFVSRKLYPNVDFYSGIIYRACGFPLDMYPLLFALPRIAGWLAHWYESLREEKSAAKASIPGATHVMRARQTYVGDVNKELPSQEERKDISNQNKSLAALKTYHSNLSKRRRAPGTAQSF